LEAFTITRIVELRQYTLHPGRRDELIDLFEREFIESQEAAGITLIGLFRDARRPERFVWLRGFAEMESRRKALARFYDGAVWRQHRDAANATMVDSDNVFLLRLENSAEEAELSRTCVRAPLFCLTYSFTNEDELKAFAEEFAARHRAELERNGGSILATFVTEPSENTFPRLPVREGEHTFVALSGGVALDEVASIEVQPAEVAELLPTKRSRIHY
jgi:hypothetical protein